MNNKSDLEKDFEDLKMSTDTVKEHMKAFDLFFKKETADRINTNILDTIYYDFIDLAYKSTTVYKFILDKIIEVEDELLPTFNAKQKKLFKYYDYLEDKLADDFGLQSFIYGYTLGSELQKESSDYQKNNENLKQILENIKSTKIVE